MSCVLAKRCVGESTTLGIFKQCLVYPRVATEVENHGNAGSLRHLRARRHSGERWFPELSRADLPCPSISCADRQCQSGTFEHVRPCILRRFQNANLLQGAI